MGLSLKYLRDQMGIDFKDININKFEQVVNRAYQLSGVMEEVNKCDKCNKCNHMGSGPLDSEIMLIMPYFSSNKLIEQDLNNALYKASIHNPIYKTYTVKDRESVYETSYGHLQTHLNHEIEIIKPKLIISFGEFNYSILEPFKDDYENSIGREERYLNTPIFYLKDISSFEFIKSKRELFVFKTEFLMHLKLVKSFIDKGFTSSSSFEDDFKNMGL